MDSFACTGATTQPVFKPNCGDTATLGSCKTSLCSSDSGLVLVKSERLSQTTAVFSDFPAGIIQPAVTGLRNRIAAGMFTELKAVPLPLKNSSLILPLKYIMYSMSVHSSYICKATTLSCTLNPSL